MRWLAFLLLFALNVQTLPIQQWGRQAITSFYGSAEEEVHDDCEMEKKEVADRWSAPPPSRTVVLKIVSERVHAALEAACRPSSLHAPEVLTPPPNFCQA